MKTVRNEIIFAITTVMLSFSLSIRAENLYLELVRNAEINEKDVSEAKQQLEENRDIELQDTLSVPPFHNRIANVPTARQPFCQNCHLALPHRGNQRSRSFLNMHTRYIACETCHLKPEGVKLDYRWLAYEGDDAGLQNNSLRQPEENPYSPDSIVPDYGEMIAPFYNDMPALVFMDHPYAFEVMQTWKQQSVEDKSRLKVALHAAIDKTGRGCQSCHTDRDSLLDLESLGADETQRRLISNNVIARFFTLYKKDDERLRISDLLK